MSSRVKVALVAVTLWAVGVTIMLMATSARLNRLEYNDKINGDLFLLQEKMNDAFTEEMNRLETRLPDSKEHSWPYYRRPDVDGGVSL